jgi:hypothetical protein
MKQDQRLHVRKEKLVLQGEKGDTILKLEIGSCFLSVCNVNCDRRVSVDDKRAYFVRKAWISSRTEAMLFVISSATTQKFCWLAPTASSDILSIGELQKEISDQVQLLAYKRKWSVHGFLGRRLVRRSAWHHIFLRAQCISSLLLRQDKIHTEFFFPCMTVSMEGVYCGDRGVPLLTRLNAYVWPIRCAVQQWRWDDCHEAMVCNSASFLLLRVPK